METMKTTCLCCGMVGEMEVKDKYFFDGVDGRLYEVECPRCHRSFGRKATEEPKGGEGTRRGAKRSTGCRVDASEWKGEG